MAKKAKRKTTRPKSRTTKAGGRKTGKRGKRKAKSRMGDVFTAAGAKRGVKTTATGGLGGLIALGIDLLTGDSELAKGGISIGGSVTLAAMGYENLGAGVAGGYAYGLGQRIGRESGLLSDDFRPADYADEDAMGEYPDALTEEGNALYLAEDGNLYLSDDFYKQPDGTYVLADNASPYDSQLAIANY